jgi:ubiquitin-like protein ATG12
MSTSILLASPNLPTDARTALNQLAATLDPPTLKVAIRFHAIGSAPQLKQKVFKISASSKFGTVVAFLRKKLYGKPAEGGEAKMGAGQGLFCYVNSVFAPGLDEGVGNLWRVSGSGWR